MTEEFIFLGSTRRTQVSIGTGGNAKLVGIDAQLFLQQHAVQQHLAQKPGIGIGQVGVSGYIVFGLLLKSTQLVCCNTGFEVTFGRTLVLHYFCLRLKPHTHLCILSRHGLALIIQGVEHITRTQV